jgi:glutamine synthetase|tara:strand:- start:573 stop:1628 length:1056 start_codon:yes stop_codon:yes gene_type:complete
MSKIKLEYIWLDGYNPEQNIRSKTKILDAKELEDGIKVSDLPVWSFDGSSTQQASGDNSDCLLQPVYMVKDPTREGGYIVLCEVLNADWTPHSSNTRHKLSKVSKIAAKHKFWFAFEQEYVLTNVQDKPLGFPTIGYPQPQGKYYCGIGTSNVEGRDLVEEHMDVCLEAGLDITGINAEVMIGQWEYQIMSKNTLRAADELIISRYLLIKLMERYQVVVNLSPKPVEGDWNGSGMHVNFSTHETREQGGEKLFTNICDNLGFFHQEHIEVYGKDNEKRLTGLHETQSIDKFSFGVSDRGSSIRIPISTVKNNWKGYLEDRRPASNGDPYLILSKLVDTVATSLKTQIFHEA